jgi:hypothetical protein
MFDPTDARVWIDYADRSYLATRLLWFVGLHLDVPVHAHRTTELYLKAFLVSRGRQITKRDAWGHDLGALYSECVATYPNFANRSVERRLLFLNRYFECVRYPSDRGNPVDGSLLWFSFESNVAVLDQLVAYVRPRVRVAESDWAQSRLTSAAQMDGASYERRALTDHNTELATILCGSTSDTDVAFPVEFRFDQPGC